MAAGIPLKTAKNPFLAPKPFFSRIRRQLLRKSVVQFFLVAALPLWDLCTAIGQNRAVSRGFFTTDFTDFTDENFAVQNQFPIREIRGSIPFGCGSAALCSFAAKTCWNCFIPYYCALKARGGREQRN